MKRVLLIAAVAAVSAACTGCATTSQPELVAELVGPEPAAISLHHAPQGMLVVYSAVTSQRLPCCDDYEEQRSGYDVMDTSGRVVLHVGNVSAVDDTRPPVVSLPPGRYSIHASTERQKPVVIPVLIENLALTEVHLDGSQLRDTAHATPAQLVRLADGTVVGWRAVGASEAH